MLQAHPSCSFQGCLSSRVPEDIQAHHGPWEVILPERNVPLSTLSGLHEELFNVTEVKLDKIMIKGSGTMFSSPGATQVDTQVPYALCVTTYFYRCMCSSSQM